jgi:hypothetical protein
MAERSAWHVVNRPHRLARCASRRPVPPPRLIPGDERAADERAERQAAILAALKALEEAAPRVRAFDSPTRAGPVVWGLQQVTQTMWPFGDLQTAQMPMTVQWF